MNTYLTTAKLADRIGYSPRTIREKLKDVVFVEGKHYVRPFGEKRRVLYIWEAIEAQIQCNVSANDSVPMANGGRCRG